MAAVTAFFARRSADPQTVADLTGDTFVQVITSFGTFDPGKGSARAWVFGIARRIYAAHCAAHMTVLHWSMLTVLGPGVEHHYAEEDGQRTAWMLHPDGSWTRASAVESGAPVVHQSSLAPQADQRIRAMIIPAFLVPEDHLPLGSGVDL